MVNLCALSLTRLLQAIVDRADSFRHGEGVLPACEQLTVGGWDEQYDAVTRLELLELDRAIIEAALFCMGSERVLADYGSHFLSAILLLLHMINCGLKG